MTNVGHRYLRLAVLFARVALSAAFLSSIADRFGVWGRPGTPSVIWGDFQRFVAHVDMLLPMLPRGLAPAVAWLATVVESALAFSLLVGLRTRTMGVVTACLLFLFAVVTAQSPAGLHAVLTSSVLSAAGAAMLLSAKADEI
jgi:hypothetical protein